MTKNFPTQGKKTDIQIQEAHRAAKKMNPKRPTLRYITTMSKVKDKETILKAAIGKLITLKGTPVRLSKFSVDNFVGQKSGTIYSKC